MDTIIPTGDLIDRLRARLGQRGVLTDLADTAPYCEDWRRLYHGRTPAVLRPATTDEVAAAVRLCAERGVAIGPMGGNTSTGGGDRGQLPVAFVDQLGGVGADRRRARDQCRRQQHGALRQCPRSRARA